MKAIEYTTYGAPKVLQLREVTTPIPQPDEMLIRVYASTVTAADIMMREGKPFVGRLYLGLKQPKRAVLGFEFAGEIVSTGSSVTSFKIGDKVFGGTTTLGCYAEYVCVKETDVITTIPENISYKEAAPISGTAITVVNFLKGKANIQKKHRVLINGASGGLGTYAIQYAKHIGAHVTAVCSTGNVEMVRALGADSVIDYTKNDFTKNGAKYDIIFDTVAKRSYSECKNSLKENGVYLSTVLSLPLIMHMISTSIAGSKKAKSSSTGMLPVKKRLAYLLEIRDLLKTGAIKTIIGNQYPLAQIATAHSYVEKGHKKGNLVIAV